MPITASIIGAVGALGAGGIGAAVQGGAQSNVNNLIQQSVDQLTKIGVPTAQAQQIALEHYQSSGQLTPQQAQAFKQQGTALNNIQLNPQEKQSQLNALNQLQQIGSNGGMLLSDKAQLAQQMANTNAQAQGANQAVLSNANQRGQLGSGLSLIAQLQNSQNAANQNQQNSLSIAGQAQQRALQALSSAGQLGGQLRGQDYDIAANAAKAQDAINNFNTQNTQNVSNANTSMNNAAQQYNLQNNQNIMNANTSTDNQQQIYNQQLQQQQFQDQMQQAQAAANARSQQASNLLQGGQNQAGQFAAIGSGLAKTGTTIGNYLNNNSNNNTNNQNTPNNQEEEDPANAFTTWAGSDSSNFGGVS